ncbi:MAG TPA: hypothetical protein DCY27_02985 [Desulfobacterales bacterium]|nr:hypothetical protein [Desulfobacterales bacterium]
MPKPVLLLIWSMIIIFGCGGTEVIEVEEPPSHKMEEPEPAPSPTLVGDKAKLRELADRNVVSADEVITLSNRMLQEDIAIGLDDQTLDTLEKVLLTSLPQCGKDSQAVMQRNLGITYYYNKQYRKAQQVLQCANETNPRDARTHYYLACLFNHQAKLSAAKGHQIKAKRQQKRAQIEIDAARKIDPGNPLYRKTLSLSGE